MLRKSLVAGLLFFVFAACVLEAQNVFALPGSASTALLTQVYSASPLSPITGVTTSGPGAFLVLTAAGKFYIIQTSTSVAVTDSTFATAKSIGSFSQAPTGAVVTPDGKRLAVAAGVLHFFDTSSDTELTSSVGVSVGNGISVTNVTVSLDGKTFYSLGNNSAGGSVLSSIDVATLNVTGSLAIHGVAAFVTVGRNGLIYAGTQNPNQILEVNPITLTVTSTVVLSGAPSVVAFTPDGQYALVNNKSGSGSVVSIISLATHTIVNGIPFANIGVPVDSLQIVGTGAVAAYASATQSLYELLIGSSGILSISAFPGISTGVTAIAASNEVPGGSVTVPSALFVTAAGTLNKVDLASGNVSAVSLPIPAAALSFAAQAVTGTQPVTLVQYGAGQTVAPGATSLPLVVQALDGAGRPLSGVTVTFAANSTSAFVAPTTATTASNGYAVTYVTAPSTAGTVQVTATAVGTNLKSVFNLTVAGAVAGAASSVKIVAGQGQMLPEGTSTTNAVSGAPTSPLTVLVLDINGNPVNGSPVTFTITQGLGGILSGSVANLQTATVNTDSSGHASVDFRAPAIGSSITSTPGYLQTTIVASIGTSNVTFYMTTTSLQFQYSPTVRIVTPNPGSTLSGQAGALLPGAVVVTVGSSTGLPIPFVGVTLSNGGLDPTLFPSASCNDPTGAGVLTDSTGKATCDVLFGPMIGSGSETVNVGYTHPFTNAFGISVTAGPPAKVNITQGNNQSGAPGQTLPFALKVQVTDVGGNLLAGVPVTWQVLTAGTITLKNVINTTDSNGQASALATLGNVAGPQQVKVTAGTASATFTLTVNVAAAGIQKVSGDGQTALIGTAFASQLVVKVVDAKGNAVANAPVTFAVTGGSATLGSPNPSTDSNGQASTTVTAGTSAGAVTVTATASGLSTSFSLTSLLPGPTNIAIYNGPDFAAGFTTIHSVSPGSIATITGIGIATGVEGLVAANNIIGPLPTTLAGVSVTFNGTAAPIYFVLNSNGTEQVTVQVPFEVQPGSVSVTINAAGGGSTTVNATVLPFAPGAFTTTYGNLTIAVAQRPDGSYVSPSNPAHPGDNITFYVSGLGQVAPATATGAAGVPGQNVVAPMAVAIHTSSGAPASATGAQLIAAQYAPGLVGVYAVTVQLPSDTATGPAQLFVMIVYDSQGNVYSLQSVQIPIQ